MIKNFLSYNKKFRQDIERKGDYWLERVPAWLGDYSGTVEVSSNNSLVYARMVNGQVVTVLNTVAPNIYNYAVFIGRDKLEPQIWKVASIRWLYNLKETMSYVLFHHKQHEYPAPDTVFVGRDQFTPLLVLPAGGFNVNLFGDMLYKVGMGNPIRIADQTIDTSAYVVTIGAKYVLLEILQNGTLNYISSSVYDSLELLYLQPLPKPTDGSFPVCCFIFHEGQTEHRRDSEQRTIIDLRQFTSDTGDDPTTLIFDDGVEPEDITEGSSNTGDDDFAARRDHVHHLEPHTHDLVELLMEDGVTFPPVPLTNETGDDWMYDN